MSVSDNAPIWRPRAITILIAATGALVFILLGLPLPLLLGPMSACLLAALAGVHMRGTGEFSIFMRTFLGVAVGTAITPDVISQLPSMAASLAFIPVFVLVIGLFGYPLFRYGFGFDHATAYYSAMPGGLQDMLVFGEEAGGDVRAMSLIHATRVLVIVAIAPIIMTAYWGTDLSQPPGTAARAMEPVEIGIMVVAGYLGWKLAARAGMFGASILGPMILTVALSLSGIITHRPPAEIIWASQFFIGIAVGIKYSGVTLRELRVDVAAGFAYSIVLALISLVFFEVISRSGIAPPLEAFLAFLPGGQGEMVVIAIIAGADLSYIVSHHLLRVILVILLAPVVAMVMRPK